MRAELTPEELVRFDADVAAIGKEGMLEMFGSLLEVCPFGCLFAEDERSAT